MSRLRRVLAEELEESKFADSVNKKFPIDTVSHIKTSWISIHQTREKEKYDTKTLRKITQSIIEAWKIKIDRNGPDVQI